MHSSILLHGFVVHGTEKGCNDACKEKSVCYAALEKATKSQLTARSKHCSVFLQGVVMEARFGQKLSNSPSIQNETETKI